MKPFFHAPTAVTTSILVLVACAVRAIFFYSFMLTSTGNHIHYHQADSADYHLGALCIALGNGMTIPGRNEPMFWRTPGYPAFLALFYRSVGITSSDFNGNQRAQQLTLWIQLLLCSLIPLILLYLAHFLTRSWTIAWISAWVSVVHVGLVLASTYLLTEGLGMIFFYLFLLFFFKLLLDHTSSWLLSCVLAVAMLSIYTWIRPMGEMVGILSALILLFGAMGSWRMRIAKCITFVLPFFSSLVPWYIRNYRLTGDWFYCPLSGIYLNAFCAPKILRRTMGMPLIDAWKYTQRLASQEIVRVGHALRGTGLYVSPLVSKKIALPIIIAYPLYFCADWIKEACKTAFDLYASQLVSYAKDQFWYDPLEEFLTEKIAECLWGTPVPFWIRGIAWIELLFSLMVWSGLIAGLWQLVIAPALFSKTLSCTQQRMRYIWIIAAIFVSVICGMTGGFGYARLRLPVEPLMFICAIQFWYQLVYGTYLTNSERTSIKIRPR